MKSNKSADLLKLLGHKTPSMEVSEAASSTPSRSVVPKEKKRPATRAGRSTSKAEVHSPAPGSAPVRGRGVHMWLHPDDEKNIRVISSWLAAQRGRVNDSL